MEAFKQREVAQGDDGIVRHINCIVLILWNHETNEMRQSGSTYSCYTEIFDDRYFVS